MKQVDKKSIIFIVVILAMMIISVAIVLLVTDGKETNQPNNPSNGVVENNGNGKPNEEEQSKDDHRLKDYNRYFTINQLVNNFVTYSTARNNTGMYMLLLDQYGVDNDINVDNILYNVPLDNKTYSADKIEFYELNDRIIKYNVRGFKTAVAFEAIGEQESYDTTVYLDTVNMTYAIALSYDYDANVNEISDNGYNSYSIKNMTDQQIAVLYFTDLRGKISRNNANLNKIITNYDSIDKNKVASYSNIETYKVNQMNDSLSITITDSNNIKYQFSINGVLDYNVTIS